MSKAQSSKPIEIKISTVVAVAVILRSVDSATLDAAMKSMTGGAPDYFDNEFAVLDVSACDELDTAVDWASLVTLFKAFNLNPVAVRGASPEYHAAIVACGLSIDTLAKPRQDEVQAVEPEAATAPSPAPAPTMQPGPQALDAMIVDTPVRAGQRVYARGCDLIVTAIVNNGAELIADGSIHVYAPLRGRALAGATGNADARIFALCMEAELVSIAGVYRTFEAGLPKDLDKRPAQVRLAGDRIDVLSIRA